MRAVDLLLSSLTLCCAASWAQPLKVVDQGRPAAAVVLGPRPLEDERFASDELVKYIQKTTGAVLPVVAATPPNNIGVRIHVGLSACPPAARNRVERLRADGYLIEALPTGGSSWWARAGTGPASQSTSSSNDSRVCAGFGPAAWVR
ncbi:MAG: hypothetical protein HYZ57_16205 [Acidobacteria bacterium]|nr:hypothetical protein [Acidobacteriota bacterium]